MTYHNNQAFTTKDRDNNVPRSRNCAEDSHGAWWYNACYESNLNGKYFNRDTSDWEGILWRNFYNKHSLKFTEMKIRSKV